jgi:hypothetical protein
MRNTYLSKFYWKIKQRRGAKKAIIALARKILVILFHMLKTNVAYDEQKFEIAKQKQEHFRFKKIQAEAKKFGFELVQQKTA